MLNSLTTATTAALLALTASAQASNIFPREIFRLPVEATSPTTFEVFAEDFAGPAQIWCAAAKFSDKTYGKSQKALWIERGYARSAAASGANSVVFTTEAPANPSRSVTFGIRQTGLGKSLAAARFLCDQDSKQVKIITR